MQKRTSNTDLWTRAQSKKESLRTFIDRFKRVITSVATPNKALIAALPNALWRESKFREDLILNQPMTLPDALHWANRFIEMEEDKAAMTKQQGLTRVPTIKEKKRRNITSLAIIMMQIISRMIKTQKGIDILRQWLVKQIQETME